MNIPRMHCVILVAAMASLPATAAQPTAQVLPTVYEAGRFFAIPETTNGQAFRLVVDTGGGGANGMYWITAATARRLHLDLHTCKIGDESVTVADVPAYKPGRSPPPPSGPCGNAVLVQDVPASYSRAAHDDGQFSGSYLYAHGTWTFDYPARRLILQGNTWHPDPAAHSTPLGFQRDHQGHATFGYARITIHIDGQPIDMLLDTGATAHPTPAGRKISGTRTVDGIGAASYITASVFERWRKAHPDWRIVEDGDDLFGPGHPMPIIEVPEVEIAGWSVGPVWFTERPDRAFHDMMSSMLDKRVEGAVGGNVFRHFVMTIDYPGATAYFRCARGCKSAATPRPGP